MASQLKETNVDRVNQAYAASEQARSRANDMFSSWQTANANTMAAAFAAFQLAKDSGQEALNAAELQANQMKIAASQAGITADSIYEIAQQNLERDRTIMGQRVGQQKVAIAGAGLSMAGSPTLLIRETVDQSLAEQKANFLTMAQQEASLRQQQQNSVQQAAQTTQMARSSYNFNLKKAGIQFVDAAAKAI